MSRIFLENRLPRRTASGSTRASPFSPCCRCSACR
jgi:hypothetical protein